MLRSATLLLANGPRIDKRTCFTKRYSHPVSGSRLSPKWRAIYRHALEILAAQGTDFPTTATSWTLAQKAQYRQLLEDRIWARLVS